jgi:hypothetical protein
LLRDPWASAWIKSHTSRSFGPREGLDESAVYQLFDLRRIGNTCAFDPLAHVVNRSALELEIAWPEHPRGRLVLRTNDRGLREDAAVPPEKTGARILVTGDSHTYGLVWNDESFANRLEAELRRDEGRESLEVWNAGVPFTGPYCYLGMLRKHLPLDLDAFVAVLFVGNDLFDDLNVRYWLDGWTTPRGPDEYRERIGAASERWPGPVGQGFNQAYRWKHFPWEPERALDAVLDSYVAMRDVCAAEGIAFLAVLLPTKMQIEPEDDRATQEALLAALDLAPEDLTPDAALADRFVERVRAEGVRCLDPRDAMRAAPHPLYWRFDYHLGLTGNRLLAELLADEVRSMLGEG